MSGKPAEVEEELETTEAFCAARSIDSSLVRRLTWSSSQFHAKFYSGGYLQQLLVPSPTVDADLPLSAVEDASTALAQFPLLCYLQVH